MLAGAISKLSHYRINYRIVRHPPQRTEAAIRPDNFTERGSWCRVGTFSGAKKEIVYGNNQS